MLERINRMAAGEQVPPMPPPVAAAPPMSADPVPVAAAPVSAAAAPLVTAPPPPGVAPLAESAIVPAPAPAVASASEDSSNTFYPAEPQRREDLGISEAAVEEIAVKFMLAKGDASMREISNQLGVTFNIVEPIITRLKNEQYLGYVDQAAMNDYICRLSEKGRALAKDYSNSCTYFWNLSCQLRRLLL